MKRRLLMLGVFLLLGVVINVAVAWGCAVFIRIDHRSRLAEERAKFLADQFGGPRIWATTLARTGAVRYIYEFQAEWPFEVSKTDRFAPEWSRAAEPRRIDPLVALKPGDAAQHVLVEDARGWPLLGLYCEHVVAFTTDGRTLYVRGIDGGIALDLGPSTPPAPGAVELRARYWYSRALPLRALWPGFAINTLIYAFSLWLLTCGSFALWRQLRTRRGQCPACGYPVGVSPVCTECGRPVRPRSDSPSLAGRGSGGG